MILYLLLFINARRATPTEENYIQAMERLEQALLQRPSISQAPTYTKLLRTSEQDFPQAVEIFLQLFQKTKLKTSQTSDPMISPLSFPAFPTSPTDIDHHLPLTESPTQPQSFQEIERGLREADKAVREAGRRRLARFKAEEELFRQIEEGDKIIFARLAEERAQRLEDEQRETERRQRVQETREREQAIRDEEARRKWETEQAIIADYKQALAAEVDPIEKERIRTAALGLGSLPPNFLERFKRENPDIIPELRAHYPDYRIMFIAAKNKDNRDDVVAFLRAFVMYGLNKKRTFEEQGKFLDQYIKPILNIFTRGAIIDHMKHTLETSYSVDFDDALFILLYMMRYEDKSFLNNFTPEQQALIMEKIQSMSKDMQRTGLFKVIDPRDTAFQAELERRQREAAATEQHQRSKAYPKR